MGDLSGRTIALPESRQLDVMARLVEAEGGTVLRCPLITIQDSPDTAAVLAWIRTVIERPCDDLIFYTGEGIRRLVGFAERASLRDQVIGAFRRSRKVTRGPKPVRALRELGLDSDLVAAEPTTDGLIAALPPESLRDRRVGVQLFGEDPADALVAHLHAGGATVLSVAPYRYAPAAEEAQVEELIRQLSTGTIDLIAFTSAAQVNRLFEVAEHRHVKPLLDAAWTHTRVAAIGPVAAETLRHHGVRVDAMPDQTFAMKPLVKAIARMFEHP